MKRTSKLVFALLVTMALMAAGCGDDSDDGAGGASGTTVPDGPTITVGAQDFGESAILAQIYGQALAAHGYGVEFQDLGGYRDIEFGAFESGAINFAAEYVASTLEYLNNNAGEATSDVDATLALLEPLLADKGLVALEPAPGVNTNAFVITKDTSESLGITTISDLAEKGTALKLGGPADCPTNNACIPGLQTVYGADFSNNFIGLDTGVIPTSLENGEIGVAVMFSTDGVLADDNLVLLEDDKGLFNADNIVPITTDDVVAAYGDSFTDLINSISAKLTTDELTALNQQYSVDKADAADLAKEWLQSNGFT